ASHQRRLLHLVEYAELQLGVDVAEEQITRVTELRRQLGAEVGEDAEPGLERLAPGEVVGILRLPAERLARGLLHAREVYAALLERLERAERLIRPHHPHHPAPLQDRAGGAEEHGRP